MSKRRFAPLRQHARFYSPDEAMRLVFTGGPAEAEVCHQQLANLGQGLEGDRLRGLVVELIGLLRRHGHQHGGSFLCASGRPMTEHQISQAIGWDPACIGRDLRRIRSADLMSLEAWKPIR